MIKNKEKALKLLKQKINGEINITYREISVQTGYHEKSLVRLAPEVEKRDIDSILLHGNTGRNPSITATDSEVSYIIEFKKKYPNCSIAQFMDIYHEDVVWNPKLTKIVCQNNLKIRSYSFFCNLYKKQGWKSPIKHKSFGKKSQSHPLRDPSPRRGILIIIDGTPHDWFGNGIKFSLHLAIDDATNEILAGYFMKEECLLGYCHMLMLLIKEYGIPESFYSDKHTIFRSPIDGNLTIFGTICEDLGIELIYANTPEAKGKVEKQNSTIQNRLLNDIIRYEIKTYSELNNFFNTKYKYYLNKKFAYLPKYKVSKFIKLASKQDLSLIFTIRDTRIILDGNSISYKNYYYVIRDNNDDNYPMYKGTRVETLENIFDSSLKIKYRNKIYKTKKIEGHFQDPEKKRQALINNQKELEQILLERDERQKARANKVSS